MKIEHDFHLTLDRADLIPGLRERPPTRPRAYHFTHEARVAAWYAVQATYSVTYVDEADGSLCMEVLTELFRSGGPP